MVEWLILVESKLQPEKIIIGDFAQVRSVLRELQVNFFCHYNDPLL